MWDKVTEGCKWDKVIRHAGKLTQGFEEIKLAQGDEIKLRLRYWWDKITREDDNVKKWF